MNSLSLFVVDIEGTKLPHHEELQGVDMNGQANDETS
jgi:hypothetical protein